MLHGFSAHKDTWLTVVKVGVHPGYRAGNWPVSFWVLFCVTSVVSIPFPSTYRSTSTSCVWTCPATRGRRALTPMTTPSTGRSDGFVRYSDIEWTVWIHSSASCYFYWEPRYCSLEFVENVHLNRKPFHLVGTSMGGNVAGVYAACYAADICSMTLICPDGQCHVCVCVCV